MSRLIFTAASGAYRSYIALFSYCASRAYPDAAIFVLECEGTPEYEAAIKRHLVVPDTKYDEVYVTDIDMLLLRTTSNLFDQHSDLARIENTCYSSSKRRKEPRGSERMQGLHYRKWEWYDKTEQARTKYLDELSSGKIGLDRIDDELVLMNVTTESNLPVIYYPGNLIDLHFGIHMGTIRAYKAHGSNAIREQLRIRVSPDMASDLVSIEDELIKCIDVNTESGKKVSEELKTLLDFCKGRMKVKKSEPT